MKTIKFAVISLLVCVAIFTGYKSYNKMNPTNQSKLLLLHNVEALARNEIGEKPCRVIQYVEKWYDGCLYYTAVCGEGYYVGIYRIRCLAR